MRVATYNIHRCVGTDGRLDVERIAAVLAEVDADVVGLQEVAAHFAHSRIDQAEALAQRLDMTCIEGRLLLEGIGWYGNALLTRLPVRRVRRLVYDEVGKEPRGLLDVDLVAADGRLWRIVNTHLDVRRRARKPQFHTLLAYLRSLDAPVVLIGDLNEWCPWSRRLRALARELALPLAPPSVPSTMPVLRLDWLGLKGCRPAGAPRRHLTRRSRTASDHLPVFADLVAE